MAEVDSAPDFGPPRLVTFDGDSETEEQIMSYEEKFADFIRLCDEQAKGTPVLIHNPQAIGDTYEEIIETRNRCLRLLVRIHSNDPRGGDSARQRSDLAYRMAAALF